MFQIFPFGTSVEEIKATIHGMRKLATLGCYSSGTSEHLNTSQLVDLLSQS